jgi:hypothetical protein
MANPATDDEGSPTSGSELRPYPPSWVNRLTAWLARRPWPSYYFHIGLWLLLVIVLLAGLWIEGIFPVGTLFPAQFFIPTMITLFLAMIHFLDNSAAAALETLRPALKATEEEVEQLRYRLTTLPSRPTILASVATVAIILLLGVLSGDRESSLEALASSPMATNLLLAVYWIGWWVFGAFAYHSLHQLRQIDHVYTRHTRVSLFAMGPLYAFSGVTALTAVTLAVATYGWAALNPDNLSDPISVAAMFLITGLALAVFAWPLLGTRRLLAREKAQRLDQVSLRIEAVYAQAHERIDSGEIEELEDLTKVISVLEAERDTLKAISTWPWQPETLRYLITALLLPLLLWVLQYVLQSLVGQ